MHNEVNYRVDKDTGALIFQGSPFNAQKKLEKRVEALEKEVEELKQALETMLGGEIK